MYSSLFLRLFNCYLQCNLIWLLFVYILKLVNKRERKNASSVFYPVYFLFWIYYCHVLKSSCALYTQSIPYRVHIGEKERRGCRK